MTTAQQHVDSDLIDRDDINEYGSSTTPVVLGLAQSYGSTPLTEFCFRTGRAVRSPASWAMRKGKVLEALYLERFADETGIQVEKPQQKFIHPEHPWIVCHVDGLSEDGETLVEVKSSDAPELWADGITDYTTAQVQHQAACIPTVRRIFVPVGAGRDWHVYDVKPKPKLFSDYILPSLIEFRDHVLRDEMPPPRTYEECYKAFGVAQGKGIELDEGLRLWIEEMEELGRAAKVNKTKLENVKFQLAERMAGAEHITVNGMPVLTRREVNRGGYTVQPTSYATMRVTKWWERLKNGGDADV